MIWAPTSLLRWSTEAAVVDPLRHRRVLVALSADPVADADVSAWLLGVVGSLRAARAAVLVSLPGSAESLTDQLTSHGAIVLPATDDRVAQVTALAEGWSSPDFVLAQGTDLSLALADSGALTAALWAMPLDNPSGQLPLDATTGILGQRLADGVDRIVVTHHVAAAWLEGLVGRLESRVTVLAPGADPAATLLPADPSYGTHPRSLTPTKVVLSTHNFAFTRQLLDLLEARSDIEVSHRPLGHAVNLPCRARARLLAWADVVICDWASRQSVWYSQHVRDDQRLIVRLHGSELDTPPADELNVERCSAIVVVSGHPRRRAVEERGWPADTCVVIGNTVDAVALTDPSTTKPDSTRHGRVRADAQAAGSCPRPPRCTPRARAAVPPAPARPPALSYRWLWEDDTQRTFFEEFYARLRADEGLRSAVSFDPYGPSMANWYRKVGWMLSPSDRESFHLAPVEGMASGAVPVIWDRVGARDIFGDHYLHASTDDAAAWILRHLDTWTDDGALARVESARFSGEHAAGAWLDLVLPPDDAAPPPLSLPEGPGLTVVVTDPGAVDSLAAQSLHRSLFEVRAPAALVDRVAQALPGARVADESVPPIYTRPVHLTGPVDPDHLWREWVLSA